MSDHATICLDGFAITPLSRATDAGTYTSAVSIRRGHGHACHDRVYRFIPQFPLEEQAVAYALTQARQWLTTRPQA